jgi:hypothetical protein
MIDFVLRVMPLIFDRMSYRFVRVPDKQIVDGDHYFGVSEASNSS